MRRGRWASPFVLDEKPVAGITAFLTEPGTLSGPPHRLAANARKSFQGSIVLGMGFVLEPEEAQRLIAKNSRNKDVLFPYLNGEDLNSRPDQSPRRWVINFFDWPLDRESAPDDYEGPVAADYPECLKIVEQKVKPERMKNNRKVYRDRWWHYAEKRPELYGTIAAMERVLAISRVTHHVGFAFVHAASVFADRLFICPLDHFSDFALLQSWVHEVWTREYSGTFETRLNYSPTDCLETFPFPSNLKRLESHGREYYDFRKRVMLSFQEGLTKLYNSFHDPDEYAADIQKFRDLHVEMDNAVAAAYGWDDLDLGHGFHETKQGTRFTISESARREVLTRLLKLNHERYAEEVAQGLHEKRKGGKGRGKMKAANEADFPSLFS